MTYFGYLDLIIEIVIFAAFPSLIKRDVMTSETKTEWSSEAVEIGPMERRNITTADGKVVGQLTGAYIDPNSWIVSALVSQLNKDTLDKLNVKKPLFRIPKARINTRLVKVLSDTVQLNVLMADLAGNLTVVE